MLDRSDPNAPIVPDEDADEVRTKSSPKTRASAEQPAGEASAEDVTGAGAPVSRRQRLRRALFLALPAALLVGGYFYVTGGAVMSTENAYVRADMVGVSTDVSGVVAQVDVTENQKVAAGDILFTLDDEPFRLALTRADAQVGVVAAELNALKANYRDMQAQIAQEEVEVDFYEREFERQQQLISQRVASQVTLETAQRNVDAARQKSASLKQQLGAIAANLGGDPDAAIEGHPRYVAAVAARDEAARELAHTKVRAPIAGVVTKVPSLQPGQYLAAATPAVSVVATDHMWVEANPKETELTYVRPGQTVRVSVDTYGGEEWTGTVESVSPASASSFSVLPAQNTSGNWVKVVQRIPMRVRLDTPQGKPPLRAGMSAEIEVETGHVRGLPFIGNAFAGSDAEGHD